MSNIVLDVPVMLNMSADYLRECYPERYVKFGKDIPLQPLPKHSHTNYIKIIPTDVTSPDKFYFCLKSQSASLARLEKELDRMIHHQQAGGDYKKVSKLKTGQICAARFEKKAWYRAKIINVYFSEYSVFYIDYGTVCNVAKRDVRPLSTLFLSFPAQAHSAKMWNLSRYENDWSLREITYFFDLIANKTLGAKIMRTEIKPKSNMKVSLLHVVDIYKNHMDIGRCIYYYANKHQDTQMLWNCQPQTSNTSNQHFPKVCPPNFCAEVRNHPVPREQTSVAVEEPKTEFLESQDSDDELEKANIEKCGKQIQNMHYLGDFLEGLTVKRHIKLVDLCEFKIHLILHNRRLYLTSKDISQFLWNRDLLRVKLQIHNLKIHHVIINKINHPKLFGEMLNYKLCNESFEDELSNALIIYPFSRVVDIIDKFNPDLTDLKKAVIEEFVKSGPNDAYWRNNSDEMGEGSPCRKVKDVEIVFVLKDMRETIEEELLIDNQQTLIDELHFLQRWILSLENRKKK